MSTITKTPRAKRGATVPTDAQLAARALSAQKVAQSARRKADRVAKDPAVNRSTRGRAALKVKAQALEQVSEILAGKG